MFSVPCDGKQIGEASLNEHRRLGLFRHEETEAKRPLAFGFVLHKFFGTSQLFVAAHLRHRLAQSLRTERCDPGRIEVLRSRDCAKNQTYSGISTHLCDGLSKSKRLFRGKKKTRLVQKLLREIRVAQHLCG